MSLGVSPNVANQVNGVANQVNAANQPNGAPQQGPLPGEVPVQERNAEAAGPTYEQFKALLNKAKVLDGDVLVDGANVKKVNWGGFLSRTFDADAKRTIIAGEGRQAREALYKAIRAQAIAHQGPGRFHIDLDEVAEELGVVLDENGNVVEGEGSDAVLSRLSMSHLFDRLEGKSNAIAANKVKRNIEVGGAYFAASQISSLLDKALSQFKSGTQKPSKADIKAVERLVKTYKADLEAAEKDPKANGAVKDWMEDLLVFCRGDYVSGRGRKTIDLDAVTVAGWLKNRISDEQKAATDKITDAFNSLKDKIDPYSFGPAGKLRGKELMTKEQVDIINAYEGIDKVGQGKITIGENFKTKDSKTKDPNRAFFADLILNEDLHDVVSDGIENGSNRIRNVVQKHMAAFKNLLAAASAAEPGSIPGAFEPLKTVVGEDFALAFVSALRTTAKRSAGGSDETILNTFASIAKAEHLEDKIDVGLSRCMLMEGLRGLKDLDIGEAAFNLLDKHTAAVLLEISKASQENGSVNYAQILKTYVDKNGNEGVTYPDLAKKLFALRVSQNCDLASRDLADSNERLLFVRIMDSLGNMDPSSARRLFASWMRDTGSLQQTAGVALLKGADPTVIKLLQGYHPPKANGELTETLLQVTNAMPDIPMRNLKAQLYDIFFSKGGGVFDGKKIKGITLESNLGSASIAQTVNCKLEFEGSHKDQDVVVKLIKNDSKESFDAQKEKLHRFSQMSENDAGKNIATKVATFAFVQSVSEEFDQQHELANMLLGMTTYGTEAGKEITRGFSPQPGVDFNFKCKKHVCSIKPLFNAPLGEVQNAVNQAIKNAQGDQVKLDKELREVVNKYCLGVSSGCIVMENAGVPSLDKVIATKIGLFAGRMEKSPSKEQTADADRKDYVDLLKMRSSVLEVAHELSEGLFDKDKPHMFHGDLNGGNLMYSLEDNTIKIIDYGKGMALSQEEAASFGEMFKCLSTSQGGGCSGEILGAYRKVIQAEITRVDAQLVALEKQRDGMKKQLDNQVPQGQGNVENLQAEFNKLEMDIKLKRSEMEHLKQTDASLDPKNANYSQLQIAVEGSLLNSGTDIDSLGGVVGNHNSLKDVANVVTKFKIAMQEKGMATPLPLFDFFGSMGKLGKSLAVIDSQLEVLSQRLGEASGDMTFQNDVKTKVEKLGELTKGMETSERSFECNTSGITEAGKSKGKKVDEYFKFEFKMLKPEFGSTKLNIDPLKLFGTERRLEEFHNRILNAFNRSDVKGEIVKIISEMKKELKSEQDYLKAIMEKIRTDVKAMVDVMKNKDFDGSRTGRLISRCMVCLMAKEVYKTYNDDFEAAKKDKNLIKEAEDYAEKSVRTYYGDDYATKYEGKEKADLDKLRDEYKESYLKDKSSAEVDKKLSAACTEKNWPFVDEKLFGKDNPFNWKMVEGIHSGELDTGVQTSLQSIVEKLTENGWASAHFDDFYDLLLGNEGVKKDINNVVDDFTEKYKQYMEKLDELQELVDPKNGNSGTIGATGTLFPDKVLGKVGEDISSKLSTNEVTITDNLLADKAMQWFSNLPDKIKNQAIEAGNAHLDNTIKDLEGKERSEREAILKGSADFLDDQEYGVLYNYEIKNGGVFERTAVQGGIVSNPVKYENFEDVLNEQVGKQPGKGLILGGRIQARREYAGKLVDAKKEKDNIQNDINQAGKNPYVLRAAISLLRGVDKTIEGELKNEFGVMSYVLNKEGPSNAKLNAKAKSIADTHEEKTKELDHVKIDLMFKNAGHESGVNAKGLREAVFDHFKGVLEEIDPKTVLEDTRNDEAVLAKKSLAVQLQTVETSIRDELLRRGQQTDDQAIRVDAKKILANQFTSAYVSDLIKSGDHGKGVVESFVRGTFKVGETVYEKDTSSFVTYRNRQQESIKANSMFNERKEEAA